MDFEKLPRFKRETIGIVCRVTEWANLFGVEMEEIERQIMLAHGWADNNPKKAPKKNILRYLYNWMLIADRKGSLRKKPLRNYRENRPPEEEWMTGEDFRRLREAI